MLLITSVGFLKTANAVGEVAPHLQQHSNPTELLKLQVEEGVTKIVAASKLDLNAIYTPFKSPSIAKNVQESFTIKDNIIFFQPESDNPFSIYISEKGDPSAPTYKLTIAPSPIPVGLQIKLIPTEPYFALNKTKAVQTSGGYPSMIIKMVSDSAKMLASKSHSAVIDGFVKEEDFKADPYYIGNALVNPNTMFRGVDYEIYILEVLNRSNETFELVNSDFATISPTLGVVDDQIIEEAAGVGFFPDQILQPGSSTHVILVKGK